jgi:DNA-binding NarL/FixJ family response regulator
VSARTAPGSVRILIVDDHTIVRQGLRSILELEADFTIVGEATDAAGALDQTSRLRPDVVLLDLKLTDREPADGLEVCRLLRERHAGVGIVVLTTFLEQRLLLGALHRGANAYVLKDVDTVELVRIIRGVRQGKSGFDGRSARLVIRSLTEETPESRPPGGLTPRELEVVRLAAHGATNRQVARELNISESTVKYHLRESMHKLGAKDRTEVVFKASRLDLL